MICLPIHIMKACPQMFQWLMGSLDIANKITKPLVPKLFNPRLPKVPLIIYGKLSEQKTLSPVQSQRGKLLIFIDILNHISFERFFYFFMHYYFYVLICNSINAQCESDVKSLLHCNGLQWQLLLHLSNRKWNYLSHGPA